MIAFFTNFCPPRPGGAAAAAGGAAARAQLLLGGLVQALRLSERFFRVYVPKAIVP